MITFHLTKICPSTIKLQQVCLELFIQKIRMVKLILICAEQIMILINTLNWLVIKKYKSKCCSEISTDDSIELISEIKMVYDYSELRYRNNESRYGLASKKYIYDYTVDDSTKVYVNVYSLEKQRKKNLVSQTL